MLAYYLLCLDNEDEEDDVEEDDGRPDPRHFTCDEEFVSLYRMDKDTFNFVCDSLRQYITPGTNGFSPERQLLSVLRLLGSGCDQEVVAEDNFLKMSQSTVSRCLNKVVDALLKILKIWISFPMTDREQNDVKKGFYRRHGMPNVLGVVDCIYIEILRPNVADHVNFRNRKGTYSLNVLLTCDADGLITNVIARWAGGVKDSDVWKKSHLRKYLQSSNYSGYLIGDNGFSCDPWLVTPYLDPKTTYENAFNEKIHKAMIVMQLVSQALKNRFRCLQQSDKGMIYSPEKTCRIITACCILHNISVMRNRSRDAEMSSDHDVEWPWPLIDLEDSSLTLSEQGLRLRDALAFSLEPPDDRTVESNYDGVDVSSGENSDYRLLCADLERREQRLRDQGCMDALAVEMLVKEMNADLQSREDEELM